MGMSFSSSGRVGYEWKTLTHSEYEQLLKDIQQLRDINLPLKKPTPSNTAITLEFLSPEYIEEFVTQLLVKEDEMRKSLKYQQYYSIEIKNDPTYGYQTVTDNLQRELADEVNIPLDLCLKVLQYSHQLTKKAYEISLYRKYNRLKKGSLKIGDYAPDVFLHSFFPSNGNNKVSLFPGNNNGLHRRPAVLVAGSYSWPPLRALRESLVDLSHAYSHVVDFTFVYIMEAHAEDEWPVGTVVPEDEDIGAVSLKQPTRIEDRYLVAKALNRDLPLGNDFRFLVDTIDNSFNNSYASWPFRCWIVDENGKIAYMSQPPPNGVAEDLSVTELTAWLEAFQQ